MWGGFILKIELMLSPIRIQWEVQLSIQYKDLSYKRYGCYTHTAALHLRKHTLTSFVLMSMGEGQCFLAELYVSLASFTQERGDTNKNMMHVRMTESYLDC